MGTCALNCFNDERAFNKAVGACCTSNDQCEDKHCDAGLCVGPTVYSVIKYGKVGFYRACSIIAAVFVLVLILIVIVFQCYIQKRLKANLIEKDLNKTNASFLKIRREKTNFPFDVKDLKDVKQKSPPRKAETYGNELTVNKLNDEELQEQTMK